jgi:hypothetical protein
MPNYAQSPHKNPHSDFDKNERHRQSDITLDLRLHGSSLLLPEICLLASA